MSAKEVNRLSVVHKIIDKRLTQALGAQQHGLTIRHVKQLVKKYKQYGAEVLVSKQRGQVSKETLRQWVVECGLWNAKRQKEAKIHPQRDRRDCYGELIQYRWLTP